MERSSSSFRGALKRSVTGIVEMLATRLEIFFIEFTEETLRLLKVMLFAGVALVLLLVSLLLLTFGLIAFTWDTSYSLWIFLGLVVFYTGLACIFAYSSYRLMSAKHMFSDTATVLEKDKEMLTCLMKGEE